MHIAVGWAMSLSALSIPLQQYVNKDTSDGKGGAHKRELHYSYGSEMTNKSREQSEVRVPFDKCYCSPHDLFQAFLPPPSVDGLNAQPVMASFLHII